MKLLRDLLLVLLGAVIGNAILSHSVEIATGVCERQSKGTGEWWQGTGFQSDNAAVQCGRISQVSNGWRLGYAHLGNARINEQALGDGTGKDPHWTAQGRSEAQAFTLGLWKEAHAGRFSAGAGIGLALYDTHQSGIAIHVASKAVREINTPHRRGLAPYAELGAAWKLTEQLSVAVNVTRYQGLRFNQWSNGGDETGGGDHIGAREAHITAILAGVQVNF